MHSGWDPSRILYPSDNCRYVKNTLLLQLFRPVLFFLLFVYHFSLSSSSFPNTALHSFSLIPRSQPPPLPHSTVSSAHAHNYPSVSLSLSLSCLPLRSESGFLSVLEQHRDCNSSTACNSRPPSIRQVIWPLPRRDEETMLNLPVTHSHIHYMFSLVITATACLAPARHTTDH